MPVAAAPRRSWALAAWLLACALCDVGGDDAVEDMDDRLQEVSCADDDVAEDGTCSAGGATVQAMVAASLSLKPLQSIDEVKLDYGKGKPFKGAWLLNVNNVRHQVHEEPYNYTCLPGIEPMDTSEQDAFRAKLEGLLDNSGGQSLKQAQNGKNQAPPRPGAKDSFAVPQSAAGRHSKVSAHAVILARALEGGLLPSLPRGARVLELGAGTGLVSQALTRCLPFLELEVTASESPGAAFEQLQTNVNAGGRFAANLEPLDFNNVSKLDSWGPFDLVVGGGLVHTRELAAQVLITIEAVPMTERGVVILGMGVPALPEVGERAFVKSLAEHPRFDARWLPIGELSRLIYPLYCEQSWLLLLRHRWSPFSGLAKSAGGSAME